MRTIAILNQKGGVGKTTTAVNLAACLAELGKRVLLIDLDAQANATSHHGIKPEGKGVAAVFFGEASLLDVVRPSGHAGVDLAPGSTWMSNVERALAAEPGAETLLRSEIERLPQDRWDVVIIDCPPALGLISISALTAAREVLVPVETQGMALSGLASLVQTVDKVRLRLNPDVAIAAILPTRAKTSTSLTRDVLDRLRQHFGDLVLQTSIRENTRLAEAYGFGKPINVYDPKSTGTDDYRAATREFLARS